MKVNSYELKVLVKNREITEYTKDENTYIEGRAGSEFELKLVNNSNEAVLMIPSVDGLSIIDGTSADQNSKGYIVAANSSAIIPGWTLDDNTIAKFVFADKKKSYAANHPDSPSENNVGVIGLLVFNQKQSQFEKMMEEIKKIQDKQPIVIPSPWILPQPYYPIYPTYPKRRWNDWDYWRPTYTFTCGSGQGVGTSNPLQGVLMNSSMSCSTGSVDMSNTIAEYSSVNVMTSQVGDLSQQPTQDSFELGTGFGDETQFKTTTQSFEKDVIVATIAIYYDSKKNLEKLGIVISKPNENKQAPNPFPGLAGCKPPVNWKS